MAGELMTFAALPQGAPFFFNGNRCIKRSSKTAELVDYKRTFYFRKDDVIALGWPGDGE